MSALVNISRSLLDWLVPQTCLICDCASDNDICTPCYRELPWLEESCAVCALPLPVAGICPGCQQQPPSFDVCVGSFQFREPVGSLINQFKHRHHYRNGKVLSSALRHSLQQHYRQSPWPQAIVPIPMHWRRILRRGFNQSISIAQEIRSDIHIPFLPALRRVTATPKQQGLDRKARLKNLNHAFAVNEKIELPPHVALVDDVMTTGATAEAASSVLKKAGVKVVDVWVLARTPAPESGR